MPKTRIKLKEKIHYHITNRGLAKRKIFYKEEDYEWFIDKINKFKLKYNIDIICYCLMPNHFHMIIKPDSINAVKFLKSIQASYSIHFNKKWNRKGQLFQGRYHANPINDQEQLINTIKYIIDNPVRAGLVKKAEDWPYSSVNLPKKIRNFSPTC
jgi:putative transposase